MARLAERDITALLGFVAELREVDDAMAFPPRVLESMRKLIPSDNVAYSVLDPARARSVLIVVSGEGGEQVLVSPDPDPAEELWWQLRPTHPVCGYRVGTGDWSTPLKASDFVSLDCFRRTPIYDVFYRYELDHWLDVGLTPTAQHTRVFIFARRAGRDFDERDRLVLKLLQPHLERRAQEADLAADAAAAMSALEGAAAERAERIVVTSARGAIEFATPRARALLERYLGTQNGHVPGRVVSRPVTVCSHGSSQLTINVVRIGSLRLLVIDECDLRLRRLSEREREVVEAVARGLTNREIAAELGIATQTVAKHLEHVYDKLGVHKRTAAAQLLAC